MRRIAAARWPGAWGAVYAAIVLVLAWSRLLHPAPLLAAAALLGVAGVLGVRAWRTRGRRERSGRPGHTGRPSPPLLAAALVLAGLAVAAGLATEERLDRVAADWPRLQAERTARLTRDLERRMAVVLEQGRRTAGMAAAVTGREDLSSALAELRERSGVAALAVLDGTGELRAWAGDHRGPLPLSVRLGSAEIVYVERPLFSYLYFAAPLEGRGGRAVAAVLMETALPRNGAGGAVADRFWQRTGVRPNFDAGAAPEAAWHLDSPAGPVLHVHFPERRQAEWRRDAANDGRRIVLALAAAALLLLLLVWLRRGGRGSVVPLAALAAALPVAPLDSVLGLERLFSPALFLLPAAGDVPLGTLLTILVPIAMIVASRRASRQADAQARRARLLGAAAVGLGFTAGIQLLVAGAAPPLLEDNVYLWGALQLTAVLALSILAGRVLPQESDGERARARAPVLMGGLGLSLGLALVVLARWRMAHTVDAWLPALWAAPFLLVAVGLARYAGRGSRLLRWLAAGWLAASAVVPQLWVAHMDARLQAAERELSTLGTRADPFVDYLLRQFAGEAIRRSEEGDDDVELLYRAWVGSGLARAAYPVYVTLWSAEGRRQHELALSGASRARRRGGPPPRTLSRILRRALETGQPVVEMTRQAPGANEILAVPLPDGRLVSVVVPPRRSLSRPTLLAPFLGTRPVADTRLTLVPAPVGDTLRPGMMQWERVEQGWQSETVVRYPEGRYHAHFRLRVASGGVLVARGMLILAADLAFLALLWFLGRILRGEPPRPPGGWLKGMGSFRARVTLALFAFFVLPTALFGAIAYRALSGEVSRAARLVAERAVTEAVTLFPESGGDLTALAERTGQEVLYYHRGELARASASEAIDLGLYGAWMPPSVYQTLESGEELSAVETRMLGDQPYLMAYRPLPAAGALAVPVPLAASDAAIRQRELAHLILFAVLMGGVLSLSLSLAVGRALARPIGRLGRAAAAVGDGQLAIRLPEHRNDEFGDLFASFNRMVNRLREARTQELRTARVLAWGEMARQVAHEIKNPLTPIKLSVQHLRRAYRDGHPEFGRILEGNVEQVLSEIDHLTEIARAFSRYGLPPEAEGPLEAVDCAAVVREALTLYRAGEDGTRYRLELDDELPEARARAGELKEVMFNLLENAREAVGEAGTVTVSARRDGSMICLEVRDDGVGIPAELLPRIFDPHFSTRSSGTGLGLAIVRRLVESWGGEVSAESQAGRGTTVRVRIPAADGGAPDHPGAWPGAPSDASGS